MAPSRFQQADEEGRGGWHRTGEGKRRWDAFAFNERGGKSKGLHSSPDESADGRVNRAKFYPMSLSLLSVVPNPQDRDMPWRSKVLLINLSLQGRGRHDDCKYDCNACNTTAHALLPRTTLTASGGETTSAEYRQRRTVRRTESWVEFYFSTSVVKPRWPLHGYHRLLPSRTSFWSFVAF